jgi:hypothetical protein
LNGLLGDGCALRLVVADSVGRISIKLSNLQPDRLFDPEVIGRQRFPFCDPRQSAVFP